MFIRVVASRRIPASAPSTLSESEPLCVVETARTQDSFGFSVSSRRHLRESTIASGSLPTRRDTIRRTTVVQAPAQLVNRHREYSFDPQLSKLGGEWQSNREQRVGADGQVQHVIGGGLCVREPASLAMRLRPSRAWLAANRTRVTIFPGLSFERPGALRPSGTADCAISSSGSRLWIVVRVDLSDGAQVRDARARESHPGHH
jgi:hypothetical protein